MVLRRHMLERTLEAWYVQAQTENLVQGLVAPVVQGWRCTSVQRGRCTSVQRGRFTHLELLHCRLGPKSNFLPAGGGRPAQHSARPLREDTGRGSLRPANLRAELGLAWGRPRSGNRAGVGPAQGHRGGTTENHHSLQSTGRGTVPRHASFAELGIHRAQRSTELVVLSARVCGHGACAH